jgi:endonuclease YncB( thermonuclease family)
MKYLKMKTRKTYKIVSCLKKSRRAGIDILFIAALISLGGMQQASSSKLASRVVDSPSIRVIDGDTIYIGNSKIRIFGIDAPELSQICFKDRKEVKCGEASKVALMSLIKMGTLKCLILNKDRYKRDISTCAVDGNDIGRLMVSSGWALNYEPYSKGAYQNDELEARKEKRGVWSMQFIEPWNWRKGSRTYR